jgi:hypothetical protein
MDARSADMEIRKERISMVALIALAVVMLIWAIVTWDEPAEKPAPERHRQVSPGVEVASPHTTFTGYAG